MPEKQEVSLFRPSDLPPYMKENAAPNGSEAMKKIDLRFGTILAVVLLPLSIIEYRLFRFSAFSAQGGSGTATYVILQGMFFLVLLTAVVAFLAPITGILNKWTNCNIGWKWMFFVSVLLSALLSYLIQ